MAGIVYINALWNGFALDDNFIILRNSRIHQLGNLELILLKPYWPFYGPELGLYRPMAMLMYALQWAVGGGAAWLFHAVNLALHATATALVFLLIDRLTSRVPAFLGALLFAVHPVHTEAVANIVGQAEIIAAILVLSACLVHTGRPPGVVVSWPRRIALIILFFLAVSTKESTVTLPALLVVLDFVQRRVQLTRRGLLRYADAVFTPLFLLVAALGCYLLLRLHVLGSITGIDAAPSLPYLREDYRVLNALRAIPELLRLLIVPIELASDYSPGMLLPVTEVRPLVVYGALQLALLSAVALITPWQPLVGLSAAWFLLTVLTVSNLFFPIGVLVAERTLYLPSVSVSLLLATGWQAAAPHASRPVRRLAPLALVLILAVFAARTWIRNPDWKDTGAVHNAMLRDNPESYRSQWVHAARLSAIPGAREMARDHYTLAYRIYSRDTRFISDYAIFLISEGNYDHALLLLEEAYPDTGEVNPFSQETLDQLAYAYIATGRYHDALQTIRRSERVRSNAYTLLLRAYVYEGTGDYDLAVAALRVAVRHPDYDTWKIRSLLVRQLAQAGYVSAAAATLDSMRHSVRDTAALATIAAIQHALETGCYAPSADRKRALASGFAAAGTRLCDPVPEFFPFPAPAQNASPLQNATQAESSGGRRRP